MPGSFITYLVNAKVATESEHDPGKRRRRGYLNVLAGNMTFKNSRSDCKACLRQYLWECNECLHS